MSAKGKGSSVQDDAEDWAMLHYAVGILTGIGHRYGVIDLNIYHNGIRIRIETQPPVTKQRPRLRGKPDVP